VGLQTLFMATSAGGVALHTSSHECESARTVMGLRSAAHIAIAVPCSLHQLWAMRRGRQAGIGGREADHGAVVLCVLHRGMAIHGILSSNTREGGEFESVARGHGVLPGASSSQLSRAGGDEGTTLRVAWCVISHSSALPTGDRRVRQAPTAASRMPGSFSHASHHCDGHGIGRMEQARVVPRLLFRLAAYGPDQ
jgi:hypothetical protein